MSPKGEVSFPNLPGLGVMLRLTPRVVSLLPRPLRQQLQMLGYDISWAAFNIIEVMSASKFTFKVSGQLEAGGRLSSNRAGGGQDVALHPLPGLLS